MSMPVRVAAPLPKSTAPRLQIVRAPETQRAILPFMLLCGAILLAAMVGALLLNTAMAVSSYRIHEQEAQLAVLQEQEAELTRSLESLGSPSVLRDRAEALGMVPAGATVYLSIGSDGIIGQPTSEGE